MRFCQYAVAGYFVQIVFSGMAVDADSPDHSDWMKTLPEALHSVPLNHLAIPGTNMLLLVITHWLISATFSEKHNTTWVVADYNCLLCAYFVAQRYLIDNVCTQYMGHETRFLGSYKKSL